MQTQNYLPKVADYANKDLYIALEKLEHTEMEQIPPDLEHRVEIYKQMDRILKIVGEGR